MGVHSGASVVYTYHPMIYLSDVENVGSGERRVCFLLVGRDRHDEASQKELEKAVEDWSKLRLWKIEKIAVWSSMADSYDRFVPEGEHE